LLDFSLTRVPVAQSYRGLKLRHYTFPEGTVLRRETLGSQPLNVALGREELLLVGCSLPTQPVPGGEKVEVTLLWQALRPISADYRLSLRVIDDQGQERATSDGRLASYIYPTSRWRPGALVVGRHDVGLPLGLPPGEYGLAMRVYRYGAPGAQTVTLGRFQVARSLRQPTLADVGLTRSLGQFFGELELLGYELSPREAVPGQPVYLTLFWRARATPEERYWLAVDLGDRRWADLPLPASLTAMEPGDIFRTQYPLPVARDAPPGRWPVAVDLEWPNGQLIGPWTSLDELSVHASERLFEVPAGIQNPARMDLGGKVAFLGFDLEARVVRPGDTLHLTLYWQAEEAMDTSYTVFTHLLDAGQKTWGQVDSIPGRNSRPTNGWLPGEVLIDRYDIPVSPGAPPGQYELEIGLYDASTGKRLEVRDENGLRQEQDRILLDPILVQAK